MPAGMHSRDDTSRFFVWVYVRMYVTYKDTCMHTHKTHTHTHTCTHTTYTLIYARLSDFLDADVAQPTQHHT